MSNIRRLKGNEVNIEFVINLKPRKDFEAEDLGKGSRALKYRAVIQAVVKSEACIWLRM